VQQGYVAIFFVRIVILYLDKIYPYRRNASRRVLIQTVATTLAGDVAITLQTMLMHYLFRGHTLSYVVFYCGPGDHLHLVFGGEWNIYRFALLH
jgi:hypothetical protein